MLYRAAFPGLQDFAAAPGAIVTGFDPVAGQLFCACGEEVGPFALRRRPDGSALLTCRACHQLLAEIAADLEMHE